MRAYVRALISQFRKTKSVSLLKLKKPIFIEDFRAMFSPNSLTHWSSRPVDPWFLGKSSHQHTSLPRMQPVASR